jgi:antitoxin component of MazEF toxin-antitoxin module
MSRGMTIPQKFLKELNLEQGNYVKIFLDGGGAKRIWIEKLEE